MKRRILALLLASAMTVGLFAGCGKSEEKTDDKQVTEEKKESDGTFTMAIDYMPDSLQPSSAGSDSFTTMLRPLYQSLYYPTGSGIEYYLADSVEVSEDGLTYTVHINDDATWSDGEPITTDDILFTIDYNIVRSGRSSMTSLNGGTVEVNKIDDKTFECVLPMVDANYKNKLGVCTPIPGHAFDWDPATVDNSGYFWNTDMVTSGPYTVAEINDDSLVYAARDNYFAGTPSVKKIVLRTLGSGSSKQIAFENGEISYMRLTTAEELEKYSNDDNYNITSVSEARLNYIQVNPKAPVLSTLPAEAREAIMLALNGQEIVDAAYGSDKLAVPANSVLTPDQSLYNPDAPGYSQDLEKAKALAESSGLAGKTLTYIYNADRANMEAVATVVQQQLAAIGVNLSVEGLDSPTFFSRFFPSMGSADTYDLGSNGWDSERGSCGYQASSYLKNSESYGWSAEMSALVSKADAALTEEEAQELWDEIQDKYTEECWVFPLTYTNYVMVSQKNVTGLDGSEVVPEFVDWMSIKVD